MKKITIIIPRGKNDEVYALSSIKKQKDKLKVIIETGSNPSKNRNEGIKKAKSEYIAFINAHTILSENWVDKVEKFFLEHPETDIVGGPQLTPRDDPLFAKISGYALSSIFGAGEVRYRYKIKQMVLDANEKYVTSSNLICKKKVLKKVLFDENIYPAEDPKFISDAKKNGFKISYSPDIIVYNKRRDTLKGLTKQMFNYGFMRPKKESFKETLAHFLFLIPSIFLIYLLFFPILIIINKFYLIPLILYLIFNLVFSFYGSIKNKNLFAFFLLPFLFGVIHISYGWGFFVGTIKKLIV